VRKREKTDKTEKIYACKDKERRKEIKKRVLCKPPPPSCLFSLKAAAEEEEEQDFKSVFFLYISHVFDDEKYMSLVVYLTFIVISESLDFCYFAPIASCIG
jgi:hypothetical protein